MTAPFFLELLSFSDEREQFPAHTLVLFTMYGQWTAFILPMTGFLLDLSFH
jgi:hypothetical protein